MHRLHINDLDTDYNEWRSEEFMVKALPQRLRHAEDSGMRSRNRSRKARSQGGGGWYEKPGT